MSSCFDLMVIGGGPGGISAATVAAEAGLRVCLVDDNAVLGGQIWRGLRPETAGAQLHGRSYLHWTGRLRASRCEILSGMRVISQPASGVLRVEGAEGARDLVYRRLVLATGARERFLPFPGWTLPGVMGAGAAQAFVKAGFHPRGLTTVVSGSGPLLLAAAAGLTAKGARVAGIYEQAPLSQLAGFAATLIRQPGKLMEGARYRWQTWSTPYRSGCWVERAEGRDWVERVVVTDGRRQWTQECQLLACGYQLVANLELPRLLGCRIEGGCVVVDAHRRSSIENIACVGELTGVGGVEKALLEGQIAGFDVAGRQAEAGVLSAQLPKHLTFARRLEAAFRLREQLRRLPAGDTVVCRCEDVRFRDLQQQPSQRAARLQIRCGMGACQVRVCGTATEFLFGWEPDGGRPPIYPAEVGSMAAELTPESAAAAVGGQEAAS